MRWRSISLDLAALYLETGRTAEVKHLALEVVPQFAVQQIHSDALAAIALFEQAARKERATLALVHEVASKVRDCQSRKTAHEELSPSLSSPYPSNRCTRIRLVSGFSPIGSPIRMTMVSPGSARPASRS